VAPRTVDRVERPDGNAGGGVVDEKQRDAGRGVVARRTARRDEQIDRVRVWDEELLSREVIARSRALRARADARRVEPVALLEERERRGRLSRGELGKPLLLLPAVRGSHDRHGGEDGREEERPGNGGATELAEQDRHLQHAETETS